MLYEVTGSTEFGLGDFTDSTDEERNSLLLRKSVNSKQKPQNGQGSARKNQERTKSQLRVEEAMQLLQPEQIEH